MIRFPLAALMGACTTGVLVCATSAYAQSPQSTPDTIKLHEADRAFVANATRAVSTQRDAARIANSRSTDRFVKAFAEHISDDNAELFAALRAATPRGVDVPNSDPDTTVLDGIRELRGNDFDKAYIPQVAVGGAQKTLSIFQAEIAAGRNAQLKEAARKALPTVQENYAEARALAQRKHLVQ